MGSRIQRKLFTTFSAFLVTACISFAINTKQMVSSPLGLNAALIMAANATTNKHARNGVAEYLKKKNFGYANQWLQETMNKNITGVNVANSLWYVKEYTGQLDNSFPGLKLFFSNRFKAICGTIRKSDGHTRINDWISQQTNGKIQKIVDSINDDDILFLVNTVYFRSNFVNKFETGEDITFRGTDKTTYGVPTIEDTRNCEYCEMDNCQAVRIPFENSCYLCVILPENNDCLDKFEDLNVELFSKKWKMTSSVYMQIPRFKIESSLSFKDYCQKNAFLKPLICAKFDNICSNAIIKDIKQKTFFEIGPEGVEATSATCDEFVDESFVVPNINIKFKCDHVFIALITDKENNILFRANVKNIDEVEYVNCNNSYRRAVVKSEL